MDRRVADALHLIAHHVLNKGFEHPEGLSIELPYYEDNVQKGMLQVHAHVNLDEWPVEQHISNNPVSDYASEVFVNDEHPINATTKIPIREEELMERWGNDLDE